MLDIPSKDSIIVPSSAIEKIAEIEKVKSFLAVLALVRSPYCSEVQDSSLTVSDIFVDKRDSYLLQSNEEICLFIWMKSIGRRS